MKVCIKLDEYAGGETDIGTKSGIDMTISNSSQIYCINVHTYTHVNGHEPVSSSPPSGVV